MKFVIMILLLGLVFDTTRAASVLALGNDGPEGGDDIGIEFQILAKRVVVDIENNHPELAELFSVSEYFKVLKSISVLVVEQTLNVEFDGVTQSSVAVNFPGKNTIHINRDRWGQIYDDRVKKGIVLHEILSLLGKEGTGSYFITSLYMTKLGQNVVDIYPLPEKSKNFYTLRCDEKNSYSVTSSVNSKGIFSFKLLAQAAPAAKDIQEFARKIGHKNADLVVGLLFRQGNGVTPSDSTDPLFSINFCITAGSGLADVVCFSHSKSQVLYLIDKDQREVPVVVASRVLEIRPDRQGLSFHLRAAPNYSETMYMGLEFKLPTGACAK